MESAPETEATPKVKVENIWKRKEGKQIQYKQKYKTDWEVDPMFKGWISKSIKSPFHYYCNACDTNGSCGKSELRKHAKSMKHIKNFKEKPKYKKASGKEKQFYYCKICDKKFQSLRHTLESHKKSSKHKQALADREESEDNFVMLSNTQPNKDEHSEGDEHFQHDSEDDSSEKSPTGKESKKGIPQIIVKSLQGGPASICSTEFGTEQKVNTANGSFVVIRCDKPLFPSSTPAAVSAPICENPDIERLVTDISNVFKSDLANFFTRNETFLKSVTTNGNFASGEEGIVRLTRLMVSHLANQYLSEYTVDSWKKDSPDSKRCVATKLNKLEQTMESSVSTLKLIKAELGSADEVLQPEILLQNLDFNEF